MSGRLLEEFGSPEEVFRAPLPRLERCRLPAAVAQAVFKKQAFKRAEKELASIRGIENCRLVSRNDPETLRILNDVIILAVHANPEPVKVKQGKRQHEAILRAPPPGQPDRLGRH